MLQERLLALVQSAVIQLEAAAEPAGCLGELSAAVTCLDRHGFVVATTMGRVADGRQTTSH